MIRCTIMGATFRGCRTVFFLAFLLALGAGCGRREPGGSTAGNGAGGQTDGEPRDGGTLVVGFIADLSSVNPYATLSTSVPQEVASLMFLQLMEEQPDFSNGPPTMLPQLAQRWEYSEDRKSVTFHLREDVVWSDGVPVTAEDVRFTWQAQIHPAVAWDSAYYKESIQDVEVVDEHTVRFHVERDAVHLLLWINEGEIIPKHAWSQLPFEEWTHDSEWFLDHLVVDGPYRVTGWTPQQEIVLERNPSYFEQGRPRIDRVVIRVAADRSSLLNQILAGGLDLVYGLSVSDVPRIEGSDRLRLLAHWGRGHVFIAWNLRNPLFSDVRVRQALTMAIDRQAIVETTYGKYARVANSPVLSYVWAYNSDLKFISYDPEHARQLLAEAGFRDSDGDGILDRDGQPFRFELATNVGNQQRADATIFIQEQLRRVGIDARPRYVAFNPLMERTNQGDFEAVIMRWSMPTDLDMTFAYHSSSIGEGSNVFGYSNPELDALLVKAQQAPDAATLKGYLWQIQAIIQRDQPMTYLYEPQDLTACSRRVHFADQPPNVLRRLWHAWDWWLSPAL